MRKEIYKITRNGGYKLLGEAERIAFPRKGRTLYFLGHTYKVIENERGRAYVKLLN